MLVGSQQVDLRSAEVPVFISSAELSSRVYPDADGTHFSSNVFISFALTVLPDVDKMRKRDVSY